MLMPEQPEGLKLYYYIIAFNGVGEGRQSADFGLMLNAPEEEEEPPRKTRYR